MMLKLNPDCTDRMLPDFAVELDTAVGSNRTRVVY
ncbi:hypothetical protein J2W46_006603 [Paraburkholderia strydomiana]|nr:hypothetical protein [Paraburkholderia strydomiana]